MSFNANQLSIRVGFDLTASPKNFSITDDTNYAGVTYTDIFGVVKAVDPDGSQFYNNVDYNSPDVDYGVSISSAVLGPLPLSSGLVKNGSYKFTYSVKIVDMLQSYTIVSNNSGAKTFTITGNIVAAINNGTSANFECVDTVTTALTIVDASYSAQTGLTTVTVAETLGTLTVLAAFQFTMDVIYSNVFTQAYSYESPSVCLSWVDDECCSSMTITDETVYPGDATVTRLHTVSYPVGTPGSPAAIESPLQELTISPIYTQTWTDVFTADIETSVGIIDITDTVNGIKEHKVASDSALCQVYTCLNNMAVKYAQYLTTAPARAQEMQKYISLATVAMEAYTTGKKCGKDGYEANLSLITSIAASCGCGCDDCNDCADGTPVQVVGCCENVGGSDFTIVLDSPNGTIAIGSSTVGATTTFTIDVDSSWFASEFASELSGKTINDMADVDTGNLTPSSGQVLIWNSGTGKWERGTSQNALVDLTDVDDAGLADEMVLYWDNGTSTFKFKLITQTLVDLTDVNVVALGNGQILVYDTGTSKWVNLDFKLANLFDVDISGIADGQGIKWDAGNSEFIPFDPKLTLASLDDVDTSFNTPTANNDRFQYVTGTGWVNVPYPTFSALGVTYPIGWSGVVSSYEDFGVAYDPITDEITIRGSITNGTGAVAASVLIATLPNGRYPQVNTPFICTVGINTVGGQSIAFGEINASNGQMTIYNHLDPSNPSTGLVAGIPVGDIVFSAPIKYYKTI